MILDQVEHFSPQPASSELPHEIPKPAILGGIPVGTLVAQLRAGDRDALGVCYDALFPTLWRIAAIRTRDSELARDIVHDVFLNIWARRESLPEQLDLPVYCATAVRNRTRNIAEHDQVTASVEDAVSRETLEAPGIGQRGALPDAIAEGSEFRYAYQEALHQLTERERIGALLRWEEGYTFEQISQVFGITKMGARNIVLRAQKKVQTQLLKYWR